MPYSVSAVRNKNFGVPVSIPWYRSGGVDSSNVVAVYQPIGAADIAASYVNLTNPGTYDASVVPAKTAPTFNTSYGWSFNGSSDLLTNNLSVNQQYSWIIRYSNTTAQGVFCFGVEDIGNVQFHLYPKFTDNNQYYRCSGAYSRVAPADFASGVAAATKDAAYWNGSNIGSVGSDLSGTSSKKIAIGGTIDLTYWAGRIQALSIYDRILTDAEVLAISTAMAAL